ncbi:phosphotransferase family protein [Amycolatopsis sp. NPDC054798]
MLDAACAQAGLDSSGADVVRLGENAIFRLRAGVIVRIARSGQLAAARREVAVARWMRSTGIPAVQVTEPDNQPLDVDGRAVTFWHELPPHEYGTPVQVAQALRQLHNARPPTGLDLGRIDPFIRLAGRINHATTLTESDRSWLLDHLAELRKQWAGRPEGLPECVVHGDAWAGNVVSTQLGEVVFLDLERTSIGPSE